MERQDLAKFAEVVHERLVDRLDSSITNQEQELNKLFLWLINEVLKSTENAYPPQWKIVKAFKCEENGDSVRIGGNTVQTMFMSDPALNKGQFYSVLDEVLSLIDGLEHYEITNRFPKGTRIPIREFMIAIRD